MQVPLLNVLTRPFATRPTDLENVCKGWREIPPEERQRQASTLQAPASAAVPASAPASACDSEPPGSALVWQSTVVGLGCASVKKSPKVMQIENLRPHIIWCAHLQLEMCISSLLCSVPVMSQHMFIMRVWIHRMSLHSMFFTCMQPIYM